MSPSWAPTPRALINNGRGHSGRFASYTESAAKSLAMPPADLTAEHLFTHSDGELFWWLTHGMEGPDGKLAASDQSTGCECDPGQQAGLAQAAVKRVAL